MRRSIAVLALALAALPSCGGTETGNPPFAPGLGAGGYEPMGLLPDPELGVARVALEEGTLEACDGARHPLFRRGVIDFATGDATFAEVFEVPAGAYCAIELLVAACDDPDLCRTVAPDAITIDGTRTSDGAAIEIRDAMPIDVRLVGAFDVEPGLGALLITLDRSTLMAPLALGTIPAIDGVVRIDASTNADRLPALRTALQSAITLRRDLDDDLVLDPEELTAPPLAEPEAPAAP
ncbi:MAG: hypothetical protein M3Y87_01435 [Myxococcota bacterium]|nr:hypothetical protein [Myxococcota bacterium]